MHRLQRRIRSAGNRQQMAEAEFVQVGNHPAGTAATPMTMPMSMVTYAPVPDYPTHGVLTYHSLYPAWNADGGVMVPSNTPRAVPGVRPAGRM